MFGGYYRSHPGLKLGCRSVKGYREPGGREDVAFVDQEPAFDTFEICSQGSRRKSRRRRNGETALRNHPGRGSPCSLLRVSEGLENDFEVPELELEMPERVQRLEDTLLGTEQQRAPGGVFVTSMPFRLDGGAKQQLEVAADRPSLLCVDPQCHQVVAGHHRGGNRWGNRGWRG